MYGPKLPFLLMYGSHNMRHTGFLRVDGLSTDPRDLGRHTSSHNFLIFLFIFLSLYYIIQHMAQCEPFIPSAPHGSCHVSLS